MAIEKDIEQIKRLLRTAQGQISGIIKMMDEERDSLDISNQLSSTQAILKRANKEIISDCIETRVRKAIETGQVESEMSEVSYIITKLIK